MTNALKTLNILWIEDQITDFIVGLKAFMDELEKRGYKLYDHELWEANTVEDAEEKLEKCEKSKRKPDVIMLDLMLPQDEEDRENKRVNLDGGYLVWFEIRKMQKWLTLAEIPILIITARGKPEYRNQVIEDPFTIWLSKPADPQKVAESIEILLRNSINAYRKIS